MNGYVEVGLYGSLQNQRGGSSMAARIQLELESPAPLVEVLDLSQNAFFVRRRM